MANKKPTGDEPGRIEGKKRGRRALTLKQTKLVGALTTADTLSAAGERAGYGTRQASHRAFRTIQKTAPEVLATLKITPRVVLRKLAEMMDRKKTTLVINQGVVMERVDMEDNDIQLRARIHMAKLLGLEAPSQVELEVKHSYEMDFRNAKEEDLDKFLKFCSAFGRRLSVSAGVEVQAEPIDLVAR